MLNRFRGFTLIEMMICLVIASIVCVSALLVNHAFYQRNRLEIVQNELANALNYARNMAIIKNRPLTLIPLSDSHQWADGMILFVDNPSHYYLDKSDILYRWQWHYSGITIEWKGFQSKDYLTFSPSLKHATCSGSFVITSVSEGFKKIIINRLGRIRY